MREGIINSTIEYSMDDVGDTPDEQAAEGGLEAWKLAVALRRRHGVEDADTVCVTLGRREHHRDQRRTARIGPRKQPIAIKFALGARWLVARQRS